MQSLCETVWPEAAASTAAALPDALQPRVESTRAVAPRAAFTALVHQRSSTWRTLRIKQKY